MSISVDAYFPVRVTTIAERDAQPPVEGLRCFVLDDLSEYVYTLGVWVLVVTAITPETQIALDLKANLASPTFTGTVVLPSGQALIAPVLGTPASGNLANCTFPTLNQNTSGTAGGLSANIAESQVTNLVTDLGLKAPLASPTFTGTVTIPNGIPNANLPTGIRNSNSAEQSQVVVSATNYYITKSGLTMPAVAKAGMIVSTKFVWDVYMTKTNAGTGIFQISIYRGTNGSTSDTQDVLQTIGTQTAAVDSMHLRVTLYVNTTGASGAYFWTITPMTEAITATGFGVVTGTNGQFSGTVSGVAMNTASLIFGLGFKATTGTPTIRVVSVEAQAYNMD